jgi:hypothetical protein
MRCGSMRVPRQPPNFGKVRPDLLLQLPRHEGRVLLKHSKNVREPTQPQPAATNAGDQDCSGLPIRLSAGKPVKRAVGCYSSRYPYATPSLPICYPNQK